MAEKFKTSWDYIANTQESKSRYTFYQSSDQPKEPWMKRPIGEKWRDKESIWWIRTEKGREKLTENDELLKPTVPLFCPVCGRIMKRQDDTASYLLKGKCIVCHVNEMANNDIEPNINIKRQLLEDLKNIENAFLQYMKDEKLDMNDVTDEIKTKFMEKYKEKNGYK